MLNSNQLHVLLNRLGASIEDGKDQPSYAYEHHVGNGVYIYLKKTKTNEDKPNTSPIVIHPENDKLKKKIEAIEGLSSTWKPSKNSSYREFPKYNGNKSKYGFDLDSVSEESFIKLIKLISDNELHIDIPKSPVIKSSSTDKMASEEVMVVDEVTLRAIKSRRGQPKFRKSLLSAFNNTCCITGSTIISVLEAAHVISHSDETNYKVTNGLLLRADMHTLFDLNMIGIDQHGVVQISDELKESEYSEYQGVIIADDIPEETIKNLKKRFVEYSEKNGLNQSDN
jgi:hypothetical protein